MALLRVTNSRPLSRTATGRGSSLAHRGGAWRNAMRNVNHPRHPDLIADVMSILSPVILCAILLVIIDPFGCHAVPAGADTQDEDANRGPGALPLLEAARSIRIAGQVGEEPPPMPGYGSAAGIEEAWLSEVWRKHRHHFLGVFLMEEAEYLYEEHVGPPDRPRLFGSPGSLDEAVHGIFGERREARTFVAKHKTGVTRAVALGTIAFANGRDWKATADDAIGLYEAHKFNWASTGLVKTIVGRPRPGRDPEAADAADSFYSAAASNAFTWMAYADSALARRLDGRPWSRAWCAVGLYGLAGFVAYSRVEQGRHYLTDVVFGAGAGFAVGKSFYRLNHRQPEGRVSIRFQPIAVHGGMGVSVSINY